MIHYYKLVIEYKGTNYLGWQIQPEGSGKTIQGELNRSLRTITKSEQVKSLGAGRTDAGVHALGQVAKIAIPLDIAPLSLMKALNSHLPDDIKILSAEISNEEFIPTYNAISKEYHYRFTINRTPSALQMDLLANQSFDLDIEKMRAACLILIGEHDFTNFYCEGTEVASNIRQIYECEIMEVAQNGWMLPPHYVFRIVGNGFLKQMVRLLMGAIWNVGRGKITVEDLHKALGPTKLQKLGAVAPPQGLYMVRVNY